MNSHPIRPVVDTRGTRARATAVAPGRNARTAARARCPHPGCRARRRAGIDVGVGIEAAPFATTLAGRALALPRRWRLRSASRGSCVRCRMPPWNIPRRRRCPRMRRVWPRPNRRQRVVPMAAPANRPAPSFSSRRWCCRSLYRRPRRRPNASKCRSPAAKRALRLQRLPMPKSTPTSKPRPASRRRRKNPPSSSTNLRRWMRRRPWRHRSRRHRRHRPRLPTCACQQRRRPQALRPARRSATRQVTTRRESSAHAAFRRARNPVPPPRPKPRPHRRSIASRSPAHASAYDEDQPLDDRPPASADSPQVQQAWLQRIRELVARGQFDDARASLAEYRRRYPDQPLPDDLRALDE